MKGEKKQSHRTGEIRFRFFRRMMERASGLPSTPSSPPSSSLFHRLLQPYFGLAPGSENQQVTIQVAGRIVVKRAMGKRLAFLDLQSLQDNAIMQLRLLEPSYRTDDPTEFAQLVKRIKNGDIVGTAVLLSHNKALISWWLAVIPDLCLDQTNRC